MIRRVAGVRGATGRRGWAAVALSLSLTGCGSSGLSPADKLQDGVAGVVDAANGADLPGLRSALTTVRATVRTELAAQQITPEKAARVLAAVAAVERDAALVSAPPAPVQTSASPTSTPTPTTPPPTTPPPTTPPPTTQPPTTPPPTTQPPTTAPPRTATPTPTAPALTTPVPTSTVSAAP